MKKIVNLLLVLFPMMAISQTVTQNYIKTTTYKVETQNGTTNANTNAVLTNNEKLQTVNYFDGLGRPVQQVAHQQSGTGKDIVTPIEYDAFGRQAKEYLPYVPTAAASLDYKTTALTEVGTFYNTATYENTTNPFSQKEFEASPFNRVLKQAAPGEDWKLGNGHEIRFDYQANTNADLVRRFGVSFIGGNTENPYLEDEGIYDPSQLYKTITKDENWQTSQTNPKDHTTEEFKDKEGRVILKRAFDAGKWLDTYYVYDDYGNLTYVLPPKVFTYQSITQGYIDTVLYLDDMSIFSIENYTEMWVSFNENSLNISFQSQIFDSGAILKSGKIADLNMSPSLPDMPLGNIVCRNSSGQATIRGTASILNGAVYFSVSGEGVYDQEYGVNSLTLTFKTDITAYQSNFTPALLDRSTLNDLIYQYRYDKRNRLIEKKLPGKEWEFIVYDKLDRSILTQDANLRTSKKWLFTKYDVFNRPVYTGEYINTVKTTRADVQLLADTGTTLSETNQESNNINSTDLYYSNNAFPNGRDINLLTINYYDNYNFDLNGGVSTTSYGVTPITNAKGLVTGNKVRILGTADWITSLTYYDAKSRPVYSYSKNNYLAITSTVKRQFDFVGKTLETTSTHLRNGVTTSIVDIFTYDQAGRLTKQTQSINGAAVPEIIMANGYDELGQLISKKIGGKTIQGLQTIDYAYNIRGWLKNINNPDNLGQDLFGFKINYNTMNPSLPANYQDIRPLYNGNINSTSWKTNRINTLKEYCYTYDALNRFTNAYYAEDNVFNGKFNEGIPKYDRNGNIETLHRFMQDPGQSTYSKLVDILDYQYNNGNLLLKVTDVQKDSFNGELGFKDGTNTDDDYTYDANGNMILDKNKGITAIVYNHLNLPTKITFGSGTIEYKYDAAGIKQRKIVSGGATTDYAGGFQYENNVLKFFPQPEGYVEYNSGIFSYIYQYKDHLGNVRLSYSDSNNDGTITASEILEENNYYPFGLKHKNNNVVNSTHPALRYKYNEKELQDELGLNMYDYGNRNYDPALGRWMNIDPLTEQMRRFSPYNYAFNNPVYFIDPDGMAPQAGQSGIYYDWDTGEYTNKDTGDISNQADAIAYHTNSNNGKPPAFLNGFHKSYYKRRVDEQKMVRTAYALMEDVTDDALRFFGHGYKDHLTYRGTKKDGTRIYAKKLDNFLMQSSVSDKWVEIKRNGGTFISYACNNGQRGGILETASGIAELSKVIFVGATKFVSPSVDNDAGQFFSGHNKEEKGRWNIYRGGEKVGSRPWDWQPVKIDPVTLKDIAEPN